MDEGFKSGDLVFAKMKGWSPWPAKVLKRAARKTESYEVEFYGTQQKSVILPKHLFPYNEDTKNKYGGGRQRSKQAWEDALEQIEKDIPISTPTPKKVKTKTKLTEVTPQPFQPRRTRSSAKIEEKTDEGTEALSLFPPRRLSRKRSYNSDGIKENRGKSAKVSRTIANDNYDASKDTNPLEKETPLLHPRTSDSSPPTVQTTEQKDSDNDANDAGKDTNPPEGETLLLHSLTSESISSTVEIDEQKDANDAGKDTNPPEDQTLLLNSRTPETIPPTVQIAEPMQNDSKNDADDAGKDANPPEDETLLLNSRTPESIPPTVQIAEQNHSDNDANDASKGTNPQKVEPPTSESIPPKVQIVERKDACDNDAKDASKDTNPPKGKETLQLHPPTSESIPPVVQIDEQKVSSYWSNKQALFGVTGKDGNLYTLDGTRVNEARLVKTIIIELDPPEVSNSKGNLEKAAI